MMLADDLAAALATLAATPTLLVASDFDGVLAPIVDDPGGVEANEASMASLRELATVPATPVALVSGRSLDFLQALPGVPDPVWLAGSHGAELAHRPLDDLAPATQALLDRLVADFEFLAASVPGTLVEPKRGSVAFHYREADPDVVEQLRSDIIDGPASLPGVATKHGKMVIELAVFTADKGMALEQLRQDSGATAVLYLGDDITDEDAFARLGRADLGIKVGPGKTKARHRIEDPDAVAVVLAELLRLRHAELLRLRHAELLRLRHAELLRLRHRAALDEN